VEYNLADLFESVVDTVPEREALVCGDRRLTFADLDARANRLAHHLAASGVGAGDHVGVQLYNGLEYVETLLACLKLRAVPININYRYVAAELAYLYDDADLVALVVDPEFAERAAEARTPGLRHVLLAGADYEDALAAAPPERDFAPRSADDHYIIYTGGTTGMPKGVVWRHEDLFFAGLGGGDPVGEPVKTPEELAERVAASYPLVMFPVAPLMHGAAQLATFIGWLGGRKVVLVRRFDAVDVLRAIEAEKVNAASIVGDAMARPLAEALAGPCAGADMSTLFAISSAGAILSASVKEALRALLPNTILLDNFGASESGFNGTGVDGSSPEAGLRFTVNERTAVLDDALRPVAPGSGVVGHVAQRGHVPLGYYKDPEKSAQVFVQIDGERWVLLGDLATVEADGAVRVFGRGAVCINSGGEKIFPEEVEAVLKAHPAVFDAVVAGVPDERYGQRVAAVVQLRPDMALDGLDAHCRERLSGYKVPRSYVVVDEVRRSPSGKPDYRWAAATAAASGDVRPVGS
jgi:acyl-CoA synthetase (AMP-forming)/AMP-acid ligase II